MPDFWVACTVYWAGGRGLALLIAHARRLLPLSTTIFVNKFIKFIATRQDVLGSLQDGRSHTREFVAQTERIFRTQ